jgi:MFS family permease
MFANLIQIFGSYIIERTGKSKLLCMISIAISRLLWILIILLPFKIFSPIADYRIWIMVGVIAVSSLFSSLAGVGWLSWMSDLVPANSRGTYFGKRNMITLFFGMIFILIGGKFISIWEQKYSESNPYGFIILFSLGLILGFIALVFLHKIPQIQKVNKQNNGFSFKQFMAPIKDKNFLKIVVFVSAWLFAINIAAPFYGVYMIEKLKLNFSVMTFFGTIATLATLFMMKTWGPISDKLGNKPVVIVSSVMLIVIPFFWIIATPDIYYMPILIAHILSGAFMAGAGLSNFNMLIKLSPQEGRSIYLALYAAITGLVGAFAPIIGGNLTKTLQDFSFVIGSYSITNLHLIFMISSMLLIISLLLVFRIQEPESATPVAVVMQLRNDLNPQTGIVGTTDLILVELKRSEKILSKIDKVTDELAEKSEKRIAGIIEKGEKIIEKPIKKIKDIFKDDDDKEA